MLLTRIRVSPYSLPSSHSHPTSISTSFHHLHPRRLAILFLISLFTLYYFLPHSATLYIQIPASLVGNSIHISSLLQIHNDTHSTLRSPSSTPLLDSNDPSFSFSPLEPCNEPTLSLSLNPNSSSQLIAWLSPTPPLPSNSSLSSRIEAFLSSPLGSVETHKKWNEQTCSNENSPAIKWNTNQLHSRENREYWEGITEGEVRRVREELAGVLRNAEKVDKRLNQFGGETKLDGGGRGLVWTAGNADTFDRVITSLHLLRTHYSCTLPAEIFHFPSESPSPSQLSQFTLLNATLHPLSSLTKSTSSLKSFHIKGLALTASSFSQLLYLDSDSVLTRNPEFLFESPEFKEMGAVFWMDYWRDTSENGVWRLIGVQCRDERGMESGQVLIDKTKHMDTLVLLEHFLKEWKYWFRFSDGDKDLLRYAFLLLRKRWAVPSHSITPASWTNELELGEGNKGRFAGHTMVQFGLASEAWNESREKRTKGKVLFVHANLIKRITGDFNEGSTWGRSLELSLPSSSSFSSMNSSTSPARILTADDYANVSPLTGIGIPSLYSSSWSPPSLQTRQLALLSRGIRTDFWDGHRGVNYVLAIQQSWHDDQLGNEWLGREREAECIRRFGEIREETLRGIREGVVGGDEGRVGEMGEMGESGEMGFMKVVDWETREELKEFEKRFYEVGGKANGVGF